ncbi:MAG: hypothetical protein LBI01_03045 [Elusimicrobium sp.]|jgi:hypothetical protein|nr:hypothetical protein [Elusimicrobium sp.]
MKKFVTAALLMVFAAGGVFAQTQNNAQAKLRADTARIGANTRTIEAQLAASEKQTAALKDKKAKSLTEMREPVIRLDLASMPADEFNAKYCSTISVLSHVGNSLVDNEAAKKWIPEEKNNIKENRVVFLKIINDELRENGLTNKKPVDTGVYKKLYEKYKANKIMLSALFSSYLENIGFMSGFTYTDYFVVYNGVEDDVRFGIYEKLSTFAPDEMNDISEYMYGRVDCNGRSFEIKPASVAHSYDFKKFASKQNISPRLRSNIDIISNNAMIRSLIYVFGERHIRIDDIPENIKIFLIYQGDIDFGKVRPELRKELGKRFLNLKEVAKNNPKVSSYDENKKDFDKITKILIEKGILNKEGALNK